MSLQLYEEVVVTRNLPEEGLRKDDVATLIDFVPHPQGGEAGAILEIFNAVGESISVVAVPISSIAALSADQIPAVRSLAAAVA
jgi:hypothetical protein